MDKPLNIIVLLLCIISIPFLYITLTPKSKEIVVLPGLVIPEVVPTTTPIYVNQEYGFSLDLPNSWAGVTATTTKVGNSGVLVTLRHPLWTKELPRMDIPVLVYPLEQWEKWENTDFQGYKTAAPVGPTERGRNTKYVFATAPRYNYSFLSSFEEVEGILKNLKSI